MSKLHTVRLHLLCATEDVETVRAALEKALPDWLTWAPVVDDLDEVPALYLDSGQWTPEHAARLTEACEGLPVKIWRGVALAYSEPGVVVVDKGGNAGRVGEVRLTVAKAIEEEKATLQQKAKRLQPWSKVVRTLLLLLDHGVCSRDERMGRQRVAEAERGTQGDPPQGDRQGAAGEPLADAG